MLPCHKTESDLKYDWEYTFEHSQNHSISLIRLNIVYISSQRSKCRFKKFRINCPVRIRMTSENTSVIRDPYRIRLVRNLLCLKFANVDRVKSSVFFNRSDSNATWRPRIREPYDKFTPQPCFVDGRLLIFRRAFRRGDKLNFADGRWCDLCVMLTRPRRWVVPARGGAQLRHDNGKLI